MDNLPVGTWEHEVRYNVRRRREEGLTPYREARVWRRRFWCALAYGVAVTGLLVAMLRGI